jgi:radical SAM protein with 4Fe4S-binding SPASM domain
MGVPNKFDTVCHNIEYAIIRGGVVRVHALITEDTFTEADGDRFRARWGDRAVVRRSDRLSQFTDFDKCCWRALSGINVIYDGRVTPCVFDHSGHMVMGDLNTQSLRDIYSHDPYLGFRTDHSQNKATRHPLCGSCKRGYDG